MAKGKCNKSFICATFPVQLRVFTGKKNQKSKIKISSNKNFQNIFQKKIPKNVWPKPLITQISTPRQLAKPNYVMLYRMDKCFLFFHSNASQKFQKIYK
jgi:hypothetical protein